MVADDVRSVGGDSIDSLSLYNYSRGRTRKGFLYHFLFCVQTTKFDM